MNDFFLLYIHEKEEMIQKVRHWLYNKQAKPLGNQKVKTRTFSR